VGFELCLEIVQEKRRKWKGCLKKYISNDSEKKMRVIENSAKMGS
jgi:hypothetical protein